MRSSFGLVALLVVGCGSGSSVIDPIGGDASDSADASTATDASTAAPDASPDPTCALTASSDLPGVTIAFTPQGCTFTLAQAATGISIGYDIIVDTDVDGVIPAAQSSAPQAGPSGLIALEQLTGTGQSYCLCDVGLGTQPPQTPVTIKKGTYHSTFTWDGKNWNGPSDTGNPKGAAFPTGDYRLDVTSLGSVTAGDGGTRKFTVAAAFRITLIP